MAIATKLPDDERDGLPGIASAGLDRPHRLIAALVILDVQKITKNMDTGGRSASMRVRRIERLCDDDLRMALDMYHRGLNERLNQGGELFNDVLEPEMQYAFTNAYRVDPKTGEIVYYDDPRFLEVGGAVQYMTAEPISVEIKDPEF